MSSGFDIEELAKSLNVDEVSVDAHADTEWSVHFQGQPKCQSINETRLSQYRKRAAPRTCNI